MGDPRELEWAKKPDALKESWTARIGTHVYTEFPLHPLAHILSEGEWWWVELSSVASKHNGGVLVGVSHLDMRRRGGGR